MRIAALINMKYVTYCLVNRARVYKQYPALYDHDLCTVMDVIGELSNCSLDTHYSAIPLNA